MQGTQSLFLTSSLAMNTMDVGAVVGVKGSILGAIFRIRDNREIILGRDPYQCDLLLKGSRVSRKHCSVTYLPVLRQYRVIDYSLNGCYLENGARLRKETPYHLASGTAIYIGDDENIIRLG